MQGLVAVIGGCALVASYICGLLWGISYLTGWRAMARRFPATAMPRGPVYSWLSLRLWSFGGYNNALKATLGDEGIYLEMMPMFRLGHPPILFPWSVAEPMREWKQLGVTRWVLPLRVDNRTLELLFREDVRPFVNEHVARSQSSLDGPFLSRPVI